MTSTSINTPGGAMSSRPLHFFYLCDCSGSMSENGKIQALNSAIRDSIPFMIAVADNQPGAQLLVRVIKFSDHAEWHIKNPTPVESFVWNDLQADATTAMGEAIRLVAGQLRMPPMDARALPPVIVLLTDGQATDDAESAIDELLSLPWGKKAIRIAIAIGNDADSEVLRKFIGNSELESTRILQAQNADQLAALIKWASTAVVKNASAPPSTPGGSMPDPVGVIVPPPVTAVGTGDVF
jgi:uncharacterized protein YegL